MATKAPKLTIPSSKVAIDLTAGATEPAMKAAEAKSTKLYFVPVKAIEPIPGFNVRVDSPDYRAHRDMIAESIRANGFDGTKPLAGYVHKTDDGGVIYVTDGHTRLDAVNKLIEEGVEIERLPVVIRTPAPSLTDLTVALHTNNTGRPLSPFELGVVVKRLLKEDGADKKAIAERLAVTTRYLDDVLLLVNSPKKVRDAVLQGDVSSTFAIQTVRKAGNEPDKAVEVIESAINKAKAAGKTKATAKDAGPKMRKVRTSVSVATGTDMKEIVKAVAAQVREAISATAGDDDTKLAAVDGTINLVIEVPAPADPIKAAAAKPATAKKTTAKKDTSPSTDKPATKKPSAKKAAKPAPEPAGDEDENISGDDGDLGIPGATEAQEPDRTDTDLDMPSPPNVKTGEGAVDDEESDI